jgi:hypothetical protein
MVLLLSLTREEDYVAEGENKNISRAVKNEDYHYGVKRMALLRRKAA